MSVDMENEPDVVALTGASAALHISSIPFGGPVAAVRVGRVNGDFVINPSAAVLEQSDMNIVVAGTRDAVVMVEGGADFVPEDIMADAVMFAHKAIVPVMEAQDELQKLVAKAKGSPARGGCGPAPGRQGFRFGPARDGDVMTRPINSTGATAKRR